MTDDPISEISEKAKQMLADTGKTQSITTRLADLRSNTSNAIERLARAKLNLDSVRADVNRTSETNFQAATSYREAESDVLRCVDSEVQCLAEFLGRDDE